MKFLSLSALLLIALLAGCAQSTDEKYELKSPCVSADIPDAHQTPCIRRRPVNQDFS